MSMPFAAVLLAGGRSTRMKQDKALLDWQGQPLWQVQLDKLQALLPARLLLSCRREQQLLPPAGIEVVFDPENTDDGPLGAITRCLERVQMPLLVLAVDMPWMTAEFLREKLLPGGFFHGAHGYEALAGLYTPALLPMMQAALGDKHLALQPVIEACVHSGLTTTQVLGGDQTPFFRNANTLEEWQQG